MNDIHTNVDNAIKYLQSIFNANLSKHSLHKMGATFIGIKSNISGELKIYIYVLFFPFTKNNGGIPYCNNLSNIYFKDVNFNVDESFYLWIYEEMNKQNSIVMMSLEEMKFKIVTGSNNLLISINKITNRFNLEYSEWYNKEIFNEVFVIEIINPYLYLVPFPVKPIKLQTGINMNNNVTILHN